MAAIERPRNNQYQKSPPPTKPKSKRVPNVSPTSGSGSPSGDGERRYRPLPSLHGQVTDVPRPQRQPKPVPHQGENSIRQRQYRGGSNVNRSEMNVSPSGRSSSSSNSSEPPEIPPRRYLLEDVESNVSRRAFLDEDEQEPVVPSRGYLEKEPIVPPRGYLEEEPIVPPRGYLEEEPVVPPRGYLEEEPVVPARGYPLPEVDENFIERRAPMPLPPPNKHDIANERGLSPLLAREKLPKVSVKNYPLPVIPAPQHSILDTPLDDNCDHNYEDMDQWTGYDDEDEEHSYEMIEGEEWFPPDGKPLIPALLSPHNSTQGSILPRKLEESSLIHDETSIRDGDDGYVDVDADDDEYVDVNEDGNDDKYVDVNEDDNDDKYDYEFMQLDGNYGKDSRIEDKLLDDRKEDTPADLKKERYVPFKESMNKKPSIPPPPQTSYPQSSVSPKGSNSLRQRKPAVRPKYDQQTSSDVGYYNVERTDSQLQTPAEDSYYNVDMADSVKGEVHVPSASINDGYYNVQKVIPEGRTSHAPTDCGYYNIERVESHR